MSTYVYATLITKANEMHYFSTFFGMLLSASRRQHN